MIVTEVEFTLGKDDPAAIQKRVREFIEQKNATQPTDKKTAGCVFANPRAGSAGKLLEEAGLKGLREGDAIVSPLHANFIENCGHATSRDVLVLIDRVRETVRKIQGVDLEMEVKFWHN